MSDSMNQQKGSEAYRIEYTASSARPTEEKLSGSDVTDNISAEHQQYLMAIHGTMDLDLSRAGHVYSFDFLFVQP